MIHVDRSQVETPASLLKGGITERDKAIAFYSGQSTKKPNFRAYKNDDVKLALDRLFHGKCAYCESVYASTAPMDVEHWRPKGQIKRLTKTGKETALKPGYYWLAAEWTNLLPSCIDCNRQRNQHTLTPANDAVLLNPGGARALINISEVFPGIREQLHERISRGKKDLFPVKDDAYSRTPEDFLNQTEIPLLLNPCEDQPQHFLQFVEGAMVRPFPPGQLDTPPLHLWEKAANSIDVYGLNRSRLVYQREEHVLEIKAHLYTIEQLMLAFDTVAKRKTKRNEELRRIITDLIEHETLALRRYTQPQRQFSLLASQIIEEFFRGLESKALT